MARSNYIYIVFDFYGNLQGAFTVKHEMETWIERNPGKYRLDRVKDGQPHDRKYRELSIT